MYYNIFELPISFNKNKQEVSDIMKKDLELEGENNIYKYLLNSDKEVGQNTLKLWNQHYTTDINYLKDSQALLKNIAACRENNEKSEKNEHCLEIDCRETLELWKNLKSEKNFEEKYYYIQFEALKQFNESEICMHLLSLYTIASPILSLLSPLVILIIPFFFMKLKKINITMEIYWKYLKVFLQKIPLGQIFNFSSMSINQKLYACFSISFYLFQMYQNSFMCYKFYKNTYFMNDHLTKFKEYFKSTVHSMNTFLMQANLESYQPFNERLFFYAEKIKKMYKEIDTINLGDQLITKIPHIGKIMKYFYKLYANREYEECIIYSLGYHGYIDNLINITDNISNKTIRYCSFTKKSNQFKHAFYAPLKDNNPVKNSYKLNHNFIISGANASGKTTFIKTTIFNLLLSQQIGAGYYKSAKINPFHNFYCYINIPDTSDRDSLFQAEVRRCKIFLDNIKESPPDTRHFCIFDELFSGTNPYEAVASAYGYLSYLNKNKNIKFMLTTHYLDLCKEFDKDLKYIKNYNTENKYHIGRGISTVKGGIKILHELAYPEEIINLAEKMILKYV